MKIRKKYRIAGAVILFLAVFCWIQNNWLTVTYYSCRDEKIPKEFEGYRILQISDLHNKEFGKNNHKLIEKITELKPDMIVLTGDLVESSHTDIEAAVSFAEQTAAISPTYYITGNHENWLSDQDKKNLLKELENAGVVCLENEVAEIEKKTGTISVIGLNDENLADDTLKHIISETEEDRFTIALAHEPQYFSHYCDTNVDLVLTGHAHGGQFRIPFLGGVAAPDQGLFPEYTEGEHSNGTTTMIISRGLGNSIIPVRLFNLPEIVCIDLESGLSMQ